MSKVIRIQSTRTIGVTCGLDCQDVTNPDAHVPDRLKVSATWPKATVLVKAGVGYYPAEIAEWPTVKALERDNIFTLGEIIEQDNKEADALEQTMDEIRPERKKRSRTLNEITEG